MKVDLSKSVKISSQARVKVVNDFFQDSNISFDEDISADYNNFSIHSGALCLYAAALISKIHETNPSAIQLESNDREIELQNQIKQSPKYSHLTDEQVASKAHEFILKDIRNSFAHGNFKIYNSAKNGLYFVIQPQRKDFVVDIPIVISSNSLKHAIMSTMSELCASLLFLNETELKSKLSSDLNSLLKALMLPTQMLKISDYYLEGENSHKSPFRIDKKRELLVQYALLATQITYEQDDYYTIFGKDSNIFERISLIRNSIAHDNFLFGAQAKNVNHIDRNRSLDEPLAKSVTYLAAANGLKESILHAQTKGHNQDAIQTLKDKLIECFELFFSNTNSQAELTENNP